MSKLHGILSSPIPHHSSKLNLSLEYISSILICIGLGDLHYHSGPIRKVKICALSLLRQLNPLIFQNLDDSKFSNTLLSQVNFRWYPLVYHVYKCQDIPWSGRTHFWECFIHSLNSWINYGHWNFLLHLSFWKIVHSNPRTSSQIRLYKVGELREYG